MRSVVEGWKCYKILILVAILLVILMSSSLLPPGYDRHFHEELPEMPLELTPYSHGLKKEMLNSNSDVSSIFNLNWKRTQPVSPTSSVKPNNTAWSQSNVARKRDPSNSKPSPTKVLRTKTKKRRRKTLNTLTLSNMTLPKFNDSFRNPCWYDWYNGNPTFRCFPYFYLAGFPKCSSTDLYYRMASHPLVITGIQKESHYLAETYFDTKLHNCSSKFDCASVTFSSKYFSTAAQMVSMTGNTKFINSTFMQTGRKNGPSIRQVAFMEAFPRESLAIWKEGQKGKKYPGIIGDGTVSTAWDYTYFQQITENQLYGYPRNVSADWLRKIYPDSKIIMILREPVARAFSYYKMILMQQASAQDFHQRVQETIPRIKQCLESDKPATLCTSYEYTVDLHQGMYYYHIKTWLEKFPREQLLILRFEDYVVNIPETLAKVFKFLDLPAVSQEGLEFMSNYKALNVSKLKDKHMLEETRDMLTKFYKPMNEKLAKLLGDDIFLWN